MSGTINLNNKEVAVTVIEEINDMRVITQFKSYDEFIDYKERTGAIDPKEDVMVEAN